MRRRTIGTCRSCGALVRLRNRGCCSGCYQRHQKTVAAGTTTWAALEAAGKIAPVQKQRINLGPERRRI